MRTIEKASEVRKPQAAFATLHAHLIGDPTLASVNPRRLLSLYPVSLASYEPFFTRFYFNQEQTRELYYATPGWDLSGCTFNISLSMVTFEGYSDEDHENYNAIFREEIPEGLIPLSNRLLAHANAGGTIVHGAYDLIRLQMWPLLKAMWLLSGWNDAAFEDRQRDDIKEKFRSGLAKTAAFYGIELDASLLP